MGLSIVLVVALLAVALGVSVLTPAWGEQAWDLGMHLATAAVAFSLGLIAWRLGRTLRSAPWSRRLPWVAFGAGGVLLGGAHGYRSWASICGPPGGIFPGWGEGLFLAAAAALTAGALARSRSASGARWWPDWDEALVLAAAAGLVLFYVMQPVWRQPEFTLAERNLVLAQPVAWLALLVAIRALATHPAKEMVEHLESGLLAGGLLMLTLADGAHVYFSLSAPGETPFNLQPVWLFAFGLLVSGALCGYARALGAVRPLGSVRKEDAAASPIGRAGRISISSIAVGAVVLTILLSEYVGAGEPSDFALLVISALVTGVLARQTWIAWLGALRERQARWREAKLRDQLLSLSGVVATLNTSLQVGGALTQAVAETARASGAAAACLWIPDPTGKELAPVEQFGLPAEIEPATLLARAEEALRAAPESRSLEHRELFPGQEEPWTCLTLRLGGEKEDHGYLVLLRRAGSFDEVERLLGETVALNIGSGMRGVRLLTEARRLADRDPVTSLFNHRAIHQRLTAEIARCQRAGSPVAVVMVDLDNFKLLNDTYGHPAGDQVLKRVSQVLGRACRASDVVGRYGGDEFIILLPETNLDGALRVVERIRSQLDKETCLVSDVGPVPVRLSYGVAICPDDSASSHELVATADRNLYAAKRQGGDGVITSGYQEHASDVRAVAGFNLLEAMVIAVDNKDRYTRRHSEEVTAYSCRLARKLGLAEETIRSLRVSGLVHDVGKIGVPDRILRKPGRLTEDEQELMRQHPVLGALIVGALPSMDDVVVDGVRYHHERWDGLGYPTGLGGANIPLTGRIMALADAFSAMTTDRPYHRALSFAEAMEEITRGAGTQFDPDLAPHFLEVIREIGENGRREVAGERLLDELAPEAAPEPVKAGKKRRK